MAEIEIAVCTHNRATELSRCLSVLEKQSCPPEHWHVLVINNASTDATEDVVEHFRRRNTLPGLRCVTEPRLGLTSARQRAVEESDARFIAFVDDDCHLAPDWLSQLRRAIARYPMVVAFGGQVRPVWRDGIDPKLRKHGWIFAEQPHGEVKEEGEVAALVGAGLVVSRESLIDTGWVNKPLIEDRIGRGATSGGDVEIVNRLRSNGGRLMYIPAMVLDHHVDIERQELNGMLELSNGLGAGAALVECAQLDGDTQAHIAKAVRQSRRQQRRLLVAWLTRKFNTIDWRIYIAFERGYKASLLRLIRERSV